MTIPVILLSFYWLWDSLLLLDSYVILIESFILIIFHLMVF